MCKYCIMAKIAALETLIKYNIDLLPVNLEFLADAAKIKIDIYSQSHFVQLLNDNIKNGEGFIIDYNGIKRIFINDKINSRHRRRFTLAHELGHAFLNHDIGKIYHSNNEIDNINSIQELQANIFARDILMPQAVLAALNIHTPYNIMEICDISYKPACIRAETLKKLYKNGEFNSHPLEKQLIKQFDNFIRNYNK